MAKKLFYKNAMGVLLLVNLCYFLPLQVQSQEKQQEPSQSKEHQMSSDEALGKKLANPIGQLLLVGVQNDLDYGIGLNKGVRDVLTIKPIIPIQIAQKLNLITRISIQMTQQYNTSVINHFGFLDPNASFLFSPILKPGSPFFLGGGPVVQVPSGSDFSNKQTALGFMYFTVVQQKGFTYGGYFMQTWGLGSAPDGLTYYNQFYINPFVGYTFKSGSTLNIIGEITHDWVPNRTNINIVPQINALATIGKQKINLTIGPRFNMNTSDDFRCDFGMRAGLTFVIQKPHK